jgi:uncharacterized protein DUF2695
VRNRAAAAIAANEEEKMMTEIMTPKSQRWDAFAAALDEAIECEGCDGDEGQASLGRTHRHAKKIMGDMGAIDVEASLAFFKENGGYCDCEVLMNVDAVSEAKPPSTRRVH